MEVWLSLIGEHLGHMILINSAETDQWEDGTMVKHRRDMV